jgi:hypothetical protein
MSLFKRRNFLSAILVTAVVTVLFAISGCSPASTPTSEFQKESTPATTSTASTSAPATTAAGKIAGFEIYENKDPFQPLYGPGATTRTVTTSSTTTGTGAGGTTSTTTTTSQTQVTLVSITGTSATINVGGTDYPNLAANSVFAGSFKVVSVGTGSVTILFGDNQYTLYLGETVNVK